MTQLNALRILAEELLNIHIRDAVTDLVVNSRFNVADIGAAASAEAGPEAQILGLLGSSGWAGR